MSQKGIAMVIAIVLALVVSATAAVVLGLTFRRFELSAFRTDHAVAEAADDAGLQYTFARLDKDLTFTDPAYPGKAGFRNVVQAAAPSEYVISSDPAVASGVRLVPALHMGGVLRGGQMVGGKNVTIRVLYYRPGIDTPPVANRPYRIRSSSTFGTGGT